MAIVWRTAVWILLVFTAATPLMAMKVRPVNLEEMTDRAATIFSGRCTRIEVAHDPEVGAAVTTATFDVDRVVKGEIGSIVTVRMLGGRTKQQNGIAGPPRLEPGEEVLLFLYGQSALGLSSPVGLGQGKFTIFEDKRGKKVTVNAFGNDALWRNLSADARNLLGSKIPVSNAAAGLDPTELLDMAEVLQRGDDR